MVTSIAFMETESSARTSALQRLCHNRKFRPSAAKAALILHH